MLTGTLLNVGTNLKRSLASMCVAENVANICTTQICALSHFEHCDAHAQVHAMQILNANVREKSMAPHLCHIEDRGYQRTSVLLFC
jgi:hypothetical protein